MLREAAELAEVLRRSEVDAEEEALARRVSRCEEAVSSESTGGGGDLQRRVDRLEASLGAATEGSLEERIGAIERLIEPEAAEAAEQHLPVTEPLAAVSHGRQPRHGATGCTRVHHGRRDAVHHMLRAAEVSPRGAVQSLVRLRSLLREPVMLWLAPRPV